MNWKKVYRGKSLFRGWWEWLNSFEASKTEIEREKLIVRLFFGYNLTVGSYGSGVCDLAEFIERHLKTVNKYDPDLVKRIDISLAQVILKLWGENRVAYKKLRGGKSALPWIFLGKFWVDIITMVVPYRRRFSQSVIAVKVVCGGDMGYISKFGRDNFKSIVNDWILIALGVNFKELKKLRRLLKC